MKNEKRSLQAKHHCIVHFVRICGNNSGSRQNEWKKYNRATKANQQFKENKERERKYQSSATVLVVFFSLTTENHINGNRNRG